MTETPRHFLKVKGLIRQLYAAFSNNAAKRNWELLLGLGAVGVVFSLLNQLSIAFKASVPDLASFPSDVSTFDAFSKFFVSAILVWLQEACAILYIQYFVLHNKSFNPGMGTFDRFIRGLVFGFVAVAVTAFFAWLTGFYRIIGVATESRPLPEPLWAFSACTVSSFGAGFFEEFLFRAYLLNAIYWVINKIVPGMKTLSKLVPAIALSSVVFGLAHPSIIPVAFLGGVLFSIAYLTRHSLWFAIGVHLAWDLSVAIFATEGGTPVVFKTIVTMSSSYLVLQGAILIGLIVFLVFTRLKQVSDIAKE
jgi:membrane protease YdiL (CAAX protease family)